MRSQPLPTHRLRHFPGRQVGRDRGTLLLERYRYGYSGVEHRLDSHIRISHYDRRIVSRISIVSPRQQIPPFAGCRNVKYEASRWRHSPALLTMTAAGTWPASRLGPLAPAVDGILSNADTPGVSTFAPPLAGDVDAIPSGDTGIVLDSSGKSLLHSLSAKATRIAIGDPPADSC